MPVAPVYETILGTSDADNITINPLTLTSSYARVRAGAGNDFVFLWNEPTLVSGTYDFRIYGEDGDDYIAAYTPATVDGGAGNDTLIAVNGLVTGAGGNDVIRGGGRLYGGIGNDQITLTEQASVVFGGEGDDTITSFALQGDTMNGGSGVDTFAFHAAVSEPRFIPFYPPATPYPTTVKDVITDFVVGEDKIYVTGYQQQSFSELSIRSVNGGEDALITLKDFYGNYNTIKLSGVSASSLDAGSFIFDNAVGANIFSHDGGITDIKGTEYNDMIALYNAADQTIQGMEGDDSLAGGNGVKISGGDGNDNIQLADSAIGTRGSYANGGAGNDTIISATQSMSEVSYTATLVGGEGNDLLIGEESTYGLLEQKDKLFGDDGMDTLVGGSRDTLTGGAEADIFYFYDTFAFSPFSYMQVEASVNSVVTDFALGEDKLAFSGEVSFGDISVLSDTGSEVVLGVHDARIILQGISAAQVTEEIFDFTF